MNAGRLILSDLLSVTAEESLLCGLFGGKAIIDRDVKTAGSDRAGLEMNGHKATGKVGTQNDLRDRNVRGKRMAVDDISVMLGVIGEGEELDSGAGVAGNLQSNGNRAVFRRKVQEEIRKKGKGEGPRAKSRRLLVV